MNEDYILKNNAVYQKVDDEVARKNLEEEISTLLIQIANYTETLQKRQESLAEARSKLDSIIGVQALKISDQKVEPATVVDPQVDITK